MDRNRLVIAFLAGVCVALATALVIQTRDALPRAHAQAASGGPMFAVTGTGTTQQGRDVLFLVDGQSRTLAVYEYKVGGQLKVGAIRSLDPDLRVSGTKKGQFGKQRPTVAEMRKAVDSK